MSLLGQCIGPCVNKIDDGVFDKLREDIKSFMRGNNQKQKAEIKEKMLRASENLEFETANEYKKVLDAIEHINIQQNVENSDKKDRDILAYSSRQGYLALAVLSYRKGLLLGKQVFIVEEFGDNVEQVSDLILQFYQKYPTPPEVVINDQNVIELIGDLLDTNVVSVTKGKIHELIINAKENSDNSLDEYFLSARLDTDKLELLEKLGNLLDIPTPLHIELFDNSHLQGSFPVGAMVAFVNGEPAKKLYRRFLINQEEARDDLSSMKEVVYRHYKRLVDEEKKLPDLLLVDGGLNQIKAASLSLLEAGANVPLFGLYKNDKHQTKGLIDGAGHTYELDDKSLFFLLTRMQDEVHRFAISFHKEKRNKAMKVTILDGIPGLGDKRKEMLYRAYPDLDSLKNASIDEFSQILPREVSEALYNKLHK